LSGGGPVKKGELGEGQEKGVGRRFANYLRNGIEAPGGRESSKFRTIQTMDRGGLSEKSLGKKKWSPLKKGSQKKQGVKRKARTHH